MNLPARLVSLALACAAATLLTVHGATAQSAPAAPAAPGAPAAPSGDPAHGKAAFMSYGCYECHGTLAQGNYNGIPHLAPHPTAIRLRGVNLTEASFSSYVRAPAGQMPSYSAAILPAKDVADIWAYLASIPAGKPDSQIPALAGTTTKPN